MFPPISIEDYESDSSEFTALSLCTGRLGSKPMQQNAGATTFTRSKDTLQKAQESGKQVLKRRRSVDCATLTIGTRPSSSNNLKLNKGAQDHFGSSTKEAVCKHKASEKNARGRASNKDLSVAEKVRYRMIKNRESAARSRARKLAQEAQQQLENAELKTQNDLLKRVVRFLLAVIRSKHLKAPDQTKSYSAPL